MMRSLTLTLALLLSIGSASAFVPPPSYAAASARNVKPIGNNVVRPFAPVLPAVTLSASNDADAVSESFPREPLSIVASLWGTGGVLYVLMEALRRNLPSALEPISAGSTFFTPLQWLAYVGTVVFFAYGQGNRCLQIKLAPLVVKRSCILGATGQPQNTALNLLLAPLYAAGLISATKSRLIKSHCLIWGTAAFQVALHRGLVARNGGPLFNILNGGFAAGFAWGVVSLIWQYSRSLLTEKTPSIDAGLPS